MIIEMINKFKNLSIVMKASIAYIIATLICKGFSIITVPFFTRVMSTGQIGVVSIFNSWWSIFSIVGTLALTSGGFFTGLTEYKDERNEYKSSILSLICFVTVVIAVIFSLNMKLWEGFLQLDRKLIYIMIFSIPFEAAKDIWMMGQRFEYRYKSVFWVTVISFVFSSSCALLAVYFGKKVGYSNLAEIRLTSSYFVLFLIDAVIALRIFFKGKTFYSKRFWLFSLQISIPLIVHSLAKNVLDVSDRLMIGFFTNESNVGIYTTVYNLSTLVVIVWTAINNSFMPTLFENLKDGTNVYFKVREVINPLVLLYGVFAMVMALIAPEVINLLTTDEYMSAINIIPPVVAGVFLTCIYTLFSNVLVYYKKTKYIMLGTLLASGINIVLNYILIPQYGYVVAAYTTLVSYIVLAISQYVAMKHVVKMEIYDVKYFMVLSLSVIVSCLLCNLIYGLLIFRYLLILFIGIGILVWIKKKGKI